MSNWNNQSFLNRKQGVRQSAVCKATRSASVLRNHYGRHFSRIGGSLLGAYRISFQFTIHQLLVILKRKIPFLCFRLNVFFKIYFIYNLLVCARMQCYLVKIPCLVIGKLLLRIALKLSVDFVLLMIQKKRLVVNSQSNFLLVAMKIVFPLG